MLLGEMYKTRPTEIIETTLAIQMIAFELTPTKRSAEALIKNYRRQTHGANISVLSLMFPAIEEFASPSKG